MKNGSFVQLESGRKNFSGTAGFAFKIAERIGRSIAYMAEHLDQPLQISTLAAQANVSPSHYFALFKRQTGTPPIDFFIRLRMNHARELLDSTSLSVKEIAAMLGYHDPFYFSRVFKSIHHVAPTEYRRQTAYKSRVDLYSPNLACGERMREFQGFGSNEKTTCHKVL